ncbi:hypothetical protein EVAR_56048_1 [Eumeta japonica]|uniref:Uncharacterized protein n=1 Tax=Eumeta variegata TaxID=151549 RepID=A0A4C1Y6M6_EUMVA|nr:hypothetical protein EVAR_56048_1 [Eumeta japonica]
MICDSRDCVHHDTLIIKICHYGVRGRSLRFLESYLSGIIGARSSSSAVIIGKRGRRKKGRGALNLRIVSFVGSSERQSSVGIKCITHPHALVHADRVRLKPTKKVPLKEWRVGSTISWDSVTATPRPYYLKEIDF